METNLPLHLCQVMTTSSIINRLHMFLHGIALRTLINYRISGLYQTFKTKGVLLASSNIPYVLIFSSELVLAFLWLFSQAFRWRPVKRSVFPERLPEDNDKLPAIDVFICTADPDKEPSIGVMNTVISAMALDYPPDKLNVYLSDDGGSPLTLFAMKEAWKFACFWVPFCEKYGVKTRCLEAYFDGDEDYTGSLHRSGFILHKDEVKWRVICFVFPMSASHSKMMEEITQKQNKFEEDLRGMCFRLEDQDRSFQSRLNGLQCSHHFRHLCNYRYDRICINVKSVFKNHEKSNVMILSVDQLPFSNAGDYASAQTTEATKNSVEGEMQNGAARCSLKCHIQSNNSFLFQMYWKMNNTRCLTN